MLLHARELKKLWVHFLFYKRNLSLFWTPILIDVVVFSKPPLFVSAACCYSQMRNGYFKWCLRFGKSSWSLLGTAGRYKWRTYEGIFSQNLELSTWLGITGPSVVRLSVFQGHLVLGLSVFQGHSVLGLSVFQGHSVLRLSVFQGHLVLGLSVFQGHLVL